MKIMFKEITLTEASEEIRRDLYLIEVVEATFAASKNEEHLQEMIDISDNIFPGFKNAIGGSASMESFVATMMNVIERIIESIIELLKKCYRAIASVLSNRAKKLERLDTNVATIKRVGHNINVDLTNSDTFHDFEVVAKNILPLSVFAHRVQVMSDIVSSIHQIDKNKFETVVENRTKSKELVSDLLHLKTFHKPEVGITYDITSHLISIDHVSDIPEKSKIHIRDQHHLVDIYSDWANCIKVSDVYYSTLEKINALKKDLEKTMSSISAQVHNFKDSEEEAKKIKGSLLCYKELVDMVLSISIKVENDLTSMEKITNIVTRFISKYRKGVVE